LFLTYIMYFMNDMIAFFDSHIHWFHSDANENRARDEKVANEQA
jgi:hypothetical protein